MDDGGTPTAPYDTWAKAAASIQALDTAVAFASGDIVYIGADANCTDAAAALTIVGPTANGPVYVISSTVGAGSTVSYSVGTGDQILATGAASDITFDGAFTLIGIRIRAGRNILISGDTDEPCAAKGGIFAIGDNGIFQVSAAAYNYRSIVNCTVDMAADSGAASQPVVYAISGGLVEIIGMQFLNASNRTGTIFNTDRGRFMVSGSDFSPFTNASIELISGSASSQVYTNCKTYSTWLPWPSASGFNSAGDALFSNVGDTDDPQSMQYGNIRGLLYSSSTVYRTSGASVEAAATSWLVTTTGFCSEGVPFLTPWFYGVVNSTGSKTFDCYITNDTADFDDSQVWLEVEYLATADDAKWSLATDQRATITTTAAAQTDDVTSTWNGTGPAFTYTQKLSVPAVIGETGQYRARVAVGVASIAGSRYFYVDNTVTVS